MTRGECVVLLNKLDKAEIIYDYCIHKGKEELLTSQFVATLLGMGLLTPYSRYAFDELCKEFNLVILLDKNGNIIKIY